MSIWHVSRRKYLVKHHTSHVTLYASRVTRYRYHHTVLLPIAAPGNKRFALTPKTKTAPKDKQQANAPTTTTYCSYLTSICAST
jgi:hypothetical protein